MIGDPIPGLLWEAHEIGSMVKSSNSIPCSICRKKWEDGNQELTRDHFHGSDFGACARKTFLTMKTGRRSSFSNANFLADGHLHEASMLNNVIAGLPKEWRLKAFANEQELQTEVNGILIVSHQDALLVGEEIGVLVECKAVKDYNFRKIREEGEISLDWYGQMQAYLLAMQLEVGYLIVKHRETSKILMPIRIDRDTDYIVKRLGTLRDIKFRLENNIEQPLREETTSKSFQCQFCIFKEECWI